MPNTPPGLLSPATEADVIGMICTAGHVDHGKTRLVKLLTGCETDRLKVEKERGLTIELGFAPCSLGGKLCVGIVDVPGHEKFIRNMVAGVSGIDMAVLVIAADDGVMPQTVEHVEIMQLLGLRKGIVALTKIDLVEPSRVQEAEEEIRRFLKETFLAQAPICPVSSETFEGFPEFYKILTAQTQAAARGRAAGLFRMPIERVFFQQGFGAIVTGIPVSGKIEVGDRIEIVPGGETRKVRAIQCFLRDAQTGSAGQCLAINIPGSGKGVHERGQVACVPGSLDSSQAFHIHAQAVPSAPSPLRNAAEIKFLAGTSETPGKIYLLESKVLEPGGQALATVVLSRPIAAAPGDRFIIRRASPAATVAGGEILAASDPRRRSRKPALIKQLKERIEFFKDAPEPGTDGLIRRKAEYALLQSRPPAATVQAIAKAILATAKSVEGALESLAAEKHAIALSGGHFIHSQTYEQSLRLIQDRLREALDGGQLSITLRDLRENLDWPAALWSKIESDLEESGAATRRGEKMILPEAIGKLADPERALIEKIIYTYEQSGFHSPRPEELSMLLKTPNEKIAPLLERLIDDERLIRVSKNVIFSKNHFRRGQDLVVSAIKENGTVDSGDFKYRIDSSRKYALAILDYLDARKITVRIGNDRKLVSGYEKRLI